MEVEARVAKAPCKECPFRRTSIRGWLGTGSLNEAVPYARDAVGDHDIACHMKRENSCAGLAIFRKNIAKLPRDPAAAAAVRAVQPDRETVFARPDEFVAHHTISGGERPQEAAAPAAAAAAASDAETARALILAIDAILMRPPEPVSHPSESWCEGYAEWYDAYVVARRRVMGREGRS